MVGVFELPEIGEGVVEGEIMEWHVKPGDPVSPDQALLAVLTDKATVEIAATFSGTVVSTEGNPGDVVAVGATLLTYEGEGTAQKPVQPPAPNNLSKARVPRNKAGAVIDFPLPEIGEGVVEGEVVEWHVSVGDTVARDMPVVAVMTDKATVEITAPATGTVVEITSRAGDMIHVGEVIMKLETAEVDAAATLESTTSGAPPANNPSLSAFGTPLATPAVRKLAAKHEIDLGIVRGNGPYHRITREDVLQAIARKTGGARATPPTTASSKQSEPAPNLPPAAKTIPAARPTAPKPVPAPDTPARVGGAEHREKIRGLRKAIYTSMSRAKQIIPHFTFVDEVEMDRLVEIRAGIKQAAAVQGVKLTYLPFIAKAAVFSLRKFPILNARVDDAAGEICYKQDINIGIATATPSGLTVPVIKDVDRKSILEIAREISAVTERARNRHSTMEDITGATFTITSLGRLGGLMATPIINHPEVGILGIHNLQERAVVRNGQIVIRKMMNISISCDHRVVDGDVGASFAQEVKSYLEEPGKLLLHMT